ncbi:hypothetical protein Tco_1176159 [Tanacetum coccineum]
MAALKFASSHNMVAFLDKPTESDGFEQIVDFLNTHPIKYALTIQALMDKKKVIIAEASIRRDLNLRRKFVLECLPKCYHFCRTGKNGGKDFSGRDTPLFPIMIIQAQEQEGEGYVMPTVPQHTPTINQPASLQPQRKQQPRKSKKQNTKVSQPSDSTEPIVDKAPNDESVPTHSSDLLLSRGCIQTGEENADIDADEEVTLIDETQGRNDDNLINCSKIQEELQDELEEEERLERQKEEDANIAEWDNVQAMMDADYELAARLQAEEQGELTIKEKSKMFVELME